MGCPSGQPGVTSTMTSVFVLVFVLQQLLTKANAGKVTIVFVFEFQCFLSDITSTDIRNVIFELHCFRTGMTFAYIPTSWFSLYIESTRGLLILIIINE